MVGPGVSLEETNNQKSLCWSIHPNPSVLACVCFRLRSRVLPVSLHLELLGHASRVSDFCGGARVSGLQGRVDEMAAAVCILCRRYLPVLGVSLGPFQRRDLSILATYPMNMSTRYAT